MREWGVKTLKKLMIIAAAAFCASALPATTYAQDADVELSKVDWYRVSMVKWKPGKAERAHEITEMYQKIDKQLGRTGYMHFHMSTGEWNSIVVFPMRNGIAAMGWANNPDGKEWYDAFVKSVGGEDEAKKIFEEFDSLIADRQLQIGHIDQE